jgi:hypothetical protein
MRFMIIVKANQDSEAGKMPGDELIAAMTKYNEESAKAGVLVDAGGLWPSSKGARIRYAGGQRTVLDGPFAETKELVGGYWIVNVKSRQEAVDWVLRAPAPYGEGAEGEVEIRQMFEFADCGAGEAKDLAAVKGGI